MDGAPMAEPAAASAQDGRRMLALMTEAFGGKGGIAQFNRDLLRALAATGAARDVAILPRLGAGTPPQDAPALRQRRPVFSKGVYAARAAVETARMRPDAVLNGHLYHGPLAARLARLSGAKLISVLHGTEIWTPAAPKHLDPLLRSDLVICVSADTQRRFLDQAQGRARGRVEVLHNTYEDRYRPGDRAAARARFGLDALPAALTVGRLDDRGCYKGHDRIIPVIAQLKA